MALAWPDRLAAFLWSLKSGQYDVEGAALRVLADDDIK
jgi:cbb3-type cytochrome oxidase maturation protein